MKTSTSRRTVANWLLIFMVLVTGILVVPPADAGPVRSVGVEDAGFYMPLEQVSGFESSMLAQHPGTACYNQNRRDVFCSDNIKPARPVAPRQKYLLRKTNKQNTRWDCWFLVGKVYLSLDEGTTVNGGAWLGGKWKSGEVLGLYRSNGGGIMISHGPGGKHHDSNKIVAAYRKAMHVQDGYDLYAQFTKSCQDSTDPTYFSGVRFKLNTN